MSMRESRQLLRSTRGAFDLPSIITAVVVVGILTAGVLAAVFGVIPWAQDNAAKQDLSAVRTAEGVHLTKDGTFHDAAGLASAQYLPRSEKVDVSVNAARTCYVGLAKSGSGKVFYSTDKANEPYELTPTTVIDGKVPGCLAKDENAGLVDEVGGFDDSFFDPIGAGPGTEKDPGTAVKTPAPVSVVDPDVEQPATEVINTAVRVTELTVRDGTVEVSFQNTGTSSYRMPYSLNISCRSLTTGNVTVERVNGYFDLNANIISAMSLIACIPGTTPIDVSVPTYTGDGHVYRWRTNYTYTYAEPVTRGVTASAFHAVTGTTQTGTAAAWCIENRSNAAAVGNPVDLATCADKDGQRWQWSGDGAIRQSTLADKCLAADPAHKLVLGTCDGTGTQHFKAELFQGKTTETGLVQIRVAATGECVDIPGGIQANVQLATTPCNGTATQSWYMPGLGLGGQTVQPAEAPDPLTVTYAGTAYSEQIVDLGSSLTFYMSTGSYNTGKTISTHARLTCLDASLTTREVNLLTNVTAASSTNTGYSKTVSCGTGQIISYTVQPVTGAGMRAVSNPEIFKGVSTRETLSWDATNGYREFGENYSPAITNTGSNLTFYMSTGSDAPDRQVSAHYEVTCLDGDRTTRELNGTTVASSPDRTNRGYLQTISCGTGQVIKYRVEPLTLTGLKEATNLLDTAGYTTGKVLEWDAANGYQEFGENYSPAITNTGSNLTFYMSTGSDAPGRQVSAHYEVTCLDAALTTRELNGTTIASSPDTVNRGYLQTISCGTGQVIKYRVEPLTLTGLKESLNMLDSAGYTTGKVLEWDAANGYQEFGNNYSPAITNTGSNLTYYMSSGSNGPGRQVSAHYEVTCLDGDRTARELNGTTIASSPDTVNRGYLQTISCGTGQVIKYRVEPLTLDGLKESSNMLDTAGYTTADVLAWDAANGFQEFGVNYSPAITNTGSNLTYYMSTGSDAPYRQVSAHYEITCLDGDRTTRELNGTTTASSPDSTNRGYLQTITCGTGQVIKYRVEPLTLAGLMESSNMLDTAGYSTGDVLQWDASNGFNSIGATAYSPAIANAGSHLTFYVSTGSLNMNRQSSTHYKVTCRGTDGATYLLNGTTLVTPSSNTNTAHLMTISCGAGKVIGYTLQPLTLAGLKEASNMQDTAGYTTTGSFIWWNPSA